MSLLSHISFAPPALRAEPAPSASLPLDLAALVGPAGWARLPAAVRRRFGPGHGGATYAGRMRLRCSPVGRVHALLARLFGSPLVGANLDDVAAVVRVSCGARGGMVWARSFHADGVVPRVVQSAKEIAPGGGLFERTTGGLGMALDVFEERGALVFRSRRYWLVVGALRLPVPALLSPGTCRVTHTDLGDGLFEFALEMRHPLWGVTFEQAGVFTDPVVDPIFHPEHGATARADESQS